MTLSRRGWLVSGAGLLFGLGAEWVEFGWGDPVHWVPDLLVGWMFIGGGLVASARRPDSGSGRLLAATGFAWFVGNYSTLGWAPAAWLAAQATYLHRGVLIHTVLAYPSGRVSTRLVGAVVALGYAVALMPSVARSGVATAALGVALGVTAGREYLRGAGAGATGARTGRARCCADRGRDGRRGRGASHVPGGRAERARPARLPGGVVRDRHHADRRATAARGSGRSGRRPRGRAGRGAHRGRCATGWHGPSASPRSRSAYWSPRIGGYVDASGAPLDLPGPGAPARSR